MIEWTDPFFAGGHWVPDMIRRAGGVDVLAGLGLDPRQAIAMIGPIGRLATTAEVASTIVFLASDVSGSTTGETVNINGGAFMV